MPRSSSQASRSTSCDPPTGHAPVRAVTKKISAASSCCYATFSLMCCQSSTLACVNVQSDVTIVTAKFCPQLSVGLWYLSVDQLTLSVCLLNFDLHFSEILKTNVFRLAQLLKVKGLFSLPVTRRFHCADPGSGLF